MIPGSIKQAQQKAKRGPVLSMPFIFSVLMLGHMGALLIPGQFL